MYEWRWDLRRRKRLADECIRQARMRHSHRWIARVVLKSNPTELCDLICEQYGEAVYCKEFMREHWSFGLYAFRQVRIPDNAKLGRGDVIHRLRQVRDEYDGEEFELYFFAPVLFHPACVEWELAVFAMLDSIQIHECGEEIDVRVIPGRELFEFFTPRMVEAKEEAIRMMKSYSPRWGGGWPPVLADSECGLDLAALCSSEHMY